MDEQTELDVILNWRSLEETGGYMDVRMPSEDEATAREQLDAWIAPYPLLGTISWIAKRLAPMPHDGFDNLLGAVAAGQTIAEYREVRT